MVFLSLMIPVVYYFVERRKAKKMLDDRCMLIVKVEDQDGKKVAVDTYKYDPVTQRRLPLTDEDARRPNMKSEEDKTQKKRGQDTYKPPQGVACYYDDGYQYEQERRRKLPRTIDEYYAHKTEFRRAIETREYPDIILKFSDAEYSFKDPYKCTTCTEDDYRRMDAWSNYQMDYMGRDASDNVIAKLTDTILSDQFHPHTYLPRNGQLTPLPGHHPLHYPSQG